MRERALRKLLLKNTRIILIRLERYIHKNKQDRKNILVKYCFYKSKISKSLDTQYSYQEKLVADGVSFQKRLCCTCPHLTDIFTLYR